MIQRTALTLCSFGVAMLLSGCFTTSRLSRDQIVPGTDYDICDIITTAGDSITLKEVSGRSGIIRDSTVVGVGENGRLVKIGLSNVQSVQVVDLDAVGTVFAVLGITVVVLFTAGAILVRG